ncbi:hypothetical protein Patl1_15985 [Pistacia atlantica]|uniref:Uncharacterized protein n=1 Tax=Pistacia atlantica TaxID=434234 RepID=A0ACC1BA10_9ROSI|nr:hypothetical protein Patl1_15985 [Pistacia atlantica]
MRLTIRVLLHEMRNLGVELYMGESEGLLANFQVRLILADQVWEMQKLNPRLEKLRYKVSYGSWIDFWIRDDATLMMTSRMCVPDQTNLKREILDEVHSSAYVIHLESTKMYRTHREHYWWPSMKREILEFVSKCLVYQQVKAEHQRPVEPLQSLHVLEWKWEHIAMDFIIGAPCTKDSRNGIWVIVDRFCSFLANKDNIFSGQVGKPLCVRDN